MEVLRWVRSQGCSWDEFVPCAAARNGHLKVLKWLIKEGCHYSKRKCRRAAEEGVERARKVWERAREFLEWLEE